MIKINTINLRKIGGITQFDFLPTMTLINVVRNGEWILAFHWLWFGIHIKNH